MAESRSASSRISRNPKTRKDNQAKKFTESSDWQQHASILTKKAGTSCLFCFLYVKLSVLQHHFTRTMIVRPLIPAIAVLLAVMNPHASAQQLTKFPVISLTAGMHVIRAEVAASEAERQQGLMYREKMGPNEGMVFLFGAPASVCMWMKNTYIPLSVAFIDEHGKIINIEDMQPKTTDSHCSEKPIRYALEMNQGWFRKKNIKPGAVIEGLPR